MGRAGRIAGARRGGQGRDDSPRHERRQPAGGCGAQLQGPVGRGARPRFPVAVRAAAAGAWRDRDLQPLALRGGARRAGASRGPGPPDAAAITQARPLEAALPGDQRLGALSDRERHPRRQAVLEPVQGGAAHTLSAADRPAGPQLEVLGGRRQRAPALGRLSEGVLGDAVAHEHRVGAVACDPGGSEVVCAHRCRGRARVGADGDRSALPAREHGAAGGVAGGQARARDTGAQRRRA